MVALRTSGSFRKTLHPSNIVTNYKSSEQSFQIRSLLQENMILFDSKFGSELLLKKYF